MIDEEIICPCGGFSFLEETDETIFINRVQRLICFKHLKYNCYHCNNSFTTTESDTIVVNRINIQIRKEERKSKIKLLLKKK